MSFVYALALGIGLLVAAPYLAHRLRRRRAEERAFAAARLVDAAPPKARRRSKLEDRALFATRAAAILALAVLGASPLVRCSRLSLSRSGGASVAFALVVDDSMSMRATTAGKTRFERAKEGALELIASAREGDAVAIVLAGSPARVALAATTDLSAARAAAASLVESDRATDLDGALTVARGLIAALPQVDRRVVVLSDLADGHASGPPLGENSSIPVWFAVPELRGVVPDCAILAADRAGAHIRVEYACTEAPPSARAVVVSPIDAPKTELLRAPLPSNDLHADLTLTLTDDDPRPLVARLTGDDTIASDDEAIVVPEAGPGALAVIADTAHESAATGGAPVVEQALSALKLDIAVRPTPALPDRVEDLQPFVGVVLDDPPGLTPEQRRALQAFLEQGGVVLLAIGPRAAAAPLGATLEPVLDHPVTWGAIDAAGVKGVDPTTAAGPLMESAESITDVDARGRATLAPEDVAALEPLLKWRDGAPFVARRAFGRGEAWVTTLPFAIDESDLTLRPAFLGLLDAYVAEARARATPKRTDVGTPWTFAGATSVTIDGPAGPLLTTRDGAVVRAAPPLLGAYHVKIDGHEELRVVAPVERELDLTPRATTSTGGGPALGDNHASVDMSGPVAMLLLLFFAAEMGLRLWSRERAEAA